MIIDAVGQAWNTRDMFHSLGLVSIFTMHFEIVLCTVKLATTDKLR